MGVFFVLSAGVLNYQFLPCPQPSALSPQLSSLSPQPSAKIILFLPFLLSFLFAISEIGIDLA